MAGLPAKFKGSELFHRMNFLSQVQDIILEDCPQSSDLLSYYGHTLHMLSRRTQSKLDPALKRQMCKKCSVRLKEGVTCSVR